jgi:hypothetical protein
MHAIRNYIFNADHMEIADFLMWGQELFRLVCYVEKPHGHDQLHLYMYVPIYNSL